MRPSLQAGWAFENHLHPTAGKIIIMFTGIIERTLRILAVADGPKFRRLTLESKWTDIKHGESIAVNGCCLTAAEVMADSIGFDVIDETLNKTNLGSLKPGDEVNVERSLRVGDRIDGHFVQGHIDGTGRLVDVSSTIEEWRLTVEAPHDLAKYLVPKGSVAIDGVSLTIAALDGPRFQVALIPTTLNLTTLGDRTIGWMFNLETDVFSKTIVSYLQRMKP
jgi:riboflavin synthase